MKQTKFKKTRYLRQYNIYIFLIKLSFSSIGQNKSKLQKQISKLLILIETTTLVGMRNSQAAISINISYLFISVVLICFVLYLKKIMLSKMYIVLSY